LISDPLDGQNYNRYSYVLNNPTNMTDPTGFEGDPVVPITGSPEPGGSCRGPGCASLIAMLDKKARFEAANYCHGSLVCSKKAAMSAYMVARANFIAQANASVNLSDDVYYAALSGNPSANDGTTGAYVNYAMAIPDANGVSRTPVIVYPSETPWQTKVGRAFETLVDEALHMAEGIPMGGATIRTASAFGRAAVIAEASREVSVGVGFSAKVLAKTADEAVHFHHSYPQYLGGKFQQLLEPLPKAVHDAFHSGLDKILPRQIRGGATAYYASLPKAEQAANMAKLEAYIKAFDARYGTHLLEAAKREGMR
jgi:hypothetical protein